MRSTLILDKGAVRTAPRSSCCLLRVKLSRVKLYCRFACKTQDVILFLFTFEENIQCAKKRYYIWLQPWNALTVINEIMFTSPEAMVDFFRGKKLKLQRSSKTLLRYGNLFFTGLVLVRFRKLEFIGGLTVWFRLL